jgi:bifunctional non-homologous end joining protein LigD
MADALDVNGTDVRLTHPDKPLDPASGATKRDLVDFVVKAAPVMLPHLRGRALTLRRFPDGVDDDGFYQKRRPDGLPDHVSDVTVEARDDTLSMVTVDDPEDLAALVQLGTIEIHRMLCPADRPDHPDRLVIDLDPPGEGDFPLVRRGAGWLREALLEATGAEPQVMTTGSRGLHLVLGLDGSHDFDTVREAAEAFAARLAEAHPDHLTVAWRKEERGDRLFLDVARNARGQTAIAPYCPRARPGLPVATPVRWHEVDAELRPDGITIESLFRRLGQVDDPWDAPPPCIDPADLGRG